MADIAQQVAELTPEQKQSILQAGKRVNLICYIILAVTMVFAVGMFLFTYLQPEEEPPVSQMEELEEDFSEKQAKHNEIDRDIKELENKKQEAEFELSRLQQQVSMENGELVIKELTQEQIRRKEELSKIVIDCDNQILPLLEDRQKAREEMNEAQEKLLNADVDLDDSTDTGPDKWMVFGITILIVGVVAASCVFALLIVLKKKHPYYSDAKYSYIKKNG